MFISYHKLLFLVFFLVFILRLFSFVFFFFFYISQAFAICHCWIFFRSTSTELYNVSSVKFPTFTGNLSDTHTYTLVTRRHSIFVGLLLFLSFRLYENPQGDDGKLETMTTTKLRRLLHREIDIVVSALIFLKSDRSLFLSLSLSFSFTFCFPASIPIVVSLWIRVTLQSCENNANQPLITKIIVIDNRRTFVYLLMIIARLNSRILFSSTNHEIISIFV